MQILRNSFKIALYFFSLLMFFRLLYPISTLGFSGLWEFGYEVFISIVKGITFDSIVISISLIPFLIFSRVFSFIKLEKLKAVSSIVYFFIISLVIIYLTIIDLLYFINNNEHINLLYFYKEESDPLFLFEGLSIFYYIGIGVFVLILPFILKRLLRMKEYYRIITNILMTLLVPAILFLGFSSLVNLFTVSEKLTEFSKNEIINELPMNGVISYVLAYNQRMKKSKLSINMAKAMGYGDNIEQAYSDYLGFSILGTKEEQLKYLLQRKTPKIESIEDNMPHVIVVVGSGMGSSWLSRKTLGRLNSHFEEDIVFENIIPGADTSHGSLLVIQNNIPHRSGARFMNESKYLRLPFLTSAAKVYKEAGYKTSFLYEGNLFKNGFGKYMRKQYYDNVLGKKDFLELGVYDYIKDLLNQKTPQFILLKTKLSSLDKRTTIKGKQEFFQEESNKLSNLLNQIKNSDLKNKTILGFTIDKNDSDLKTYKENEFIEKYKVPFYLYLPNQLKPDNVNVDTVGGHEDIMTTLYNVSLSEKSYYSFGDDLISSQNSNALNPMLYMNSDVAIYKGDPISMVINKEIDQESLKLLRLQYRSNLAVSDHFLRSEFQNSHKK